MMLEVTLGEHVAVRFDDDMPEQRLTPEQAEDYLTRMARTAERPWESTTSEQAPEPALLTEDDEQP
jgi:hypothetical protein